jgi:raffinose/stachyose/melibiose transport system substrate-binding protein
LAERGIFLLPQGHVREAGLQPQKTLEEFTQACTTLKGAGMTPISVAGKEGRPMYRYLSMPSRRMMGNEFLDKLKVGEVSMTSEAGLADARFFQDLGANCLQEGFASAHYTSAPNMFLSGQSAIYYVGTWELHSLLDENSARTSPLRRIIRYCQRATLHL